jgi:hypothetical protein
MPNAALLEWLSKTARMGKGKVVGAQTGGFAVCGFSATLTRDLHIWCRNRLNESVHKRTVIGL